MQIRTFQERNVISAGEKRIRGDFYGRKKWPLCQFFHSAADGDALSTHKPAVSSGGGDGSQRTGLLVLDLDPHALTYVPSEKECIL
jgi:hypothetical protein